MNSKALVWVSLFLTISWVPAIKANDIAQWLPTKVVLYLEIVNVGEFVDGVLNDEVVNSEEFQKLVDCFGAVLNQERDENEWVEVELLESKLIDELREIGSDYQNASIVFALYLRNGKPTLLAAVKSPRAASKNSYHVGRIIGLVNSIGFEFDSDGKLQAQLDRLVEPADEIQSVDLPGSNQFVRELFTVSHDEWNVFATDRWLADEILANMNQVNKRVLSGSRKFKQHIETIRANANDSHGRISLFLNTNYLATGLVGAGVSPKDIRAFGIDRITGASASVYLDPQTNHNTFLVLDAKVNIASPREGLFLALDDGGQVDHFPFELLPNVLAFQALDFDWISFVEDAAKTYDEIYGPNSFNEWVSQMIEIEMADVDFDDDFLNRLGGTTGSAYALAKRDNSMQLTGFTEYKSHSDAMAYASKAYLTDVPDKNRATFVSREIASDIFLICHDEETVTRRFQHAKKTGLKIPREDFENLSLSHLVYENWIFTGEKESLEISASQRLSGEMPSKSTILVQAVELCRDNTNHDGPFFFERVVTFSYWEKFIQHFEYVIADLRQSEARSEKRLNQAQLQLSAFRFLQSNYGQHVVLGSNTDAGIRITGILFDGNVWKK